ncbi:nucleotidyltransferase domain-containing protein [candidate division WOR-3 bacterium]|nr:nucleotidyltransferase domain-containing protein [candidate division WOR-3 bacterium]
MDEKMDLISKIRPDSEKLEEAKIGIAYLFGSYAEEIANPGSDIDIGIVFQDTLIIRGNTFKIYNDIYQIFSDKIPEQAEDLDIVFLERSTLELQFDVIRHGRVIYETSIDFRLDYEEHVTLLYADFCPLLEEANQAILERR